MKCLKIALTGGPCGGKTTSIDEVVLEFTEKDYRVLVVPEAATILINMGIKPFGENKIDNIEFQRMVIDLQLKLESYAEEVAKKSDKKTIILCDRGIMDDKAYVTKEQFIELLKERNLTQFDVCKSYDLVIHLVTAANGKKEFYTLDNNSARSESIEEACIRDKKTLEAWLLHDNLKIIGNETDFKTKINKVIYNIYSMLKSPYPLQNQEKYLVDNIDLENIANFSPVKISIEQYIIPKENGEVIYRKTSCDGEVKYSSIVKTDTNINNERIKKQRNISEHEYFTNIPVNETPIRKVRYCFEYKEQNFRLDIFADGLKLLEIEDTNKTKKRIIPDYLTVLEDVSNNEIYRNSYIYTNKNKKECKVFNKL